MDADTLAYLPITKLASQLREKKISAIEVTRLMLERVQRANPRLHAYITVMAESALRSAMEADREIAAGRWRGALHGVPVAVKDLCQTKDAPTTCASTILREWRANQNATVVDRLEAAGAVVIGKLNLTEFAMAWYHPGLPIPLNPWNPSLWPGASSSGSGVAVAAGLCYAAIGTDTGGSIRFPSAACGIVGVKPTWGRVSRHGVFPLGESLDHIGPMTRSVADAAITLGGIAGRDPADHTSLSAPVEDYSASLGVGVKGLRVGLDENYLADAAPEVGAAVSEAVRRLERLGAQVVKVAIPDVGAATAAWTTLCGVEALAAHEPSYPSRETEYGPGFRSFLKWGATIKAADYAKANMVRERFANRFQALFDQMEVLACPSMPSVSMPANAIPADAQLLLGPNPLVRFTAPFNLSRNPTLSLPCGPSGDGPPPSLQLVGPRLGEAVLLQTGAAYQKATEWHLQRPPGE
jgi:amidase